MANIVFTTVESLDDISNAIWFAGNNESYKRTQQMVPDDDRIALIGRRDSYQQVQLVSARSPGTSWASVNVHHLILARFFLKKYSEYGSPNYIKPFLSGGIDDPVAKNALQQLIAAECGINVTKESWGKLHEAVNTVNAGLRALGVSAGDWTFIPMFKSFETQQ